MSTIQLPNQQLYQTYQPSIEKIIDDLQSLLNLDCYQKIEIDKKSIGLIEFHKVYHAVIIQLPYPKWLDVNKLSKDISILECAIPYLKDHIEMIDTTLLAKNPNPYPILTLRPNMINYYEIVKRTEPEAVRIIDELYIDYPINIWIARNVKAWRSVLKIRNIPWWKLLTNPGATDYFIENPEKIDWEYFRYNPDYRATQMFLNYLNKSDHPEKTACKYNRNLSDYYSSLSYATPVLKVYPKLIVPRGLVRNPNGVSLLTKEHLESLTHRDIQFLMKNPGAIDLIIKQPYLILWDDLALNPNPSVMSILNKYTKQYSLSHSFWKNLARTNHPGTDKLIFYYTKTKEYKKHMKEFPSHHFWSIVARKESLLGILDEYMDIYEGRVHIDIWTALLHNETSSSVELFKKYSKRLLENELKEVWKPLCRNPYAIELLDQHLEWVDYRELSLNKRLFRYN